MKGRTRNWGIGDLVLVLIALVPIIASLILYDKLPDRMAVHFGVNSGPNGYNSKSTAILIFSLLTLGMPILLKFTRRIDPKQENYEKFERAFYIIRFAIAVLLSCVFGFVLLYNLGYTLNIDHFVMVLVGLLFMVLGNYMGQIRFNYFMGIRSPWTLANEEVWRKTHRMAGPLYMVAGLVIALGGFVAATWSVGIIIGGAVLASGIPVVYSYLLYKRIVG